MCGDSGRWEEEEVVGQATQPGRRICFVWVIVISIKIFNIDIVQWPDSRNLQSGTPVWNNQMMIFKTEICRSLLSSINLIWCCQEINRSTAQMYVWPCPTSVLINIQLVWIWSVECSGIQLPGVEWNSLFYAPICLLFSRLTPHFNISCKISTHFGEENSDVIFSQSLRSFDFFLKVHLVDREEINLTTDHRDLHRVRNVDQDVLGGHNAHYWSVLHPKWR